MEGVGLFVQPTVQAAEGVLSPKAFSPNVLGSFSLLQLPDLLAGPFPSALGVIVVLELEGLCHPTPALFLSSLPVAEPL